MACARRRGGGWGAERESEKESEKDHASESEREREREMSIHEWYLSSRAKAGLRSITVLACVRCTFILHSFILCELPSFSFSFEALDSLR